MHPVYFEEKKVPILTRLTHPDQTLGVRKAYIKLKTAIIKCPYQLISRAITFQQVTCQQSGSIIGFLLWSSFLLPLTLKTSLSSSL